MLGVLNASTKGSGRIQSQTTNPVNTEGRRGAPGCLPPMGTEQGDGAAPSQGVQGDADGINPALPGVELPPAALVRALALHAQHPGGRGRWIRPSGCKGGGWCFQLGPNSSPPSPDLTR